MNQDNTGYDLEPDDPDYRAEPYPRQEVIAQPAYRGPRCFRCRYEVHGLTVGSPCPECGLPIGQGSAGLDAPTSGYATASLVMGILSLVSCTFYGVPALVFGPLAIIFASKAKAQVARGQASSSSLGLATAGKVTGIIGLCLGGAAVLLVLGFFIMAGAFAFP